MWESSVDHNTVNVVFVGAGEIDLCEFGVLVLLAFSLDGGGGLGDSDGGGFL